MWRLGRRRPPGGTVGQCWTSAGGAASRVCPAVAGALEAAEQGALRGPWRGRGTRSSQKCSGASEDCSGGQLGAGSRPKSPRLPQAPRLPLPALGGGPCCVRGCVGLRVLLARPRGRGGPSMALGAHCLGGDVKASQTLPGSPCAGPVPQRPCQGHGGGAGVVGSTGPCSASCRRAVGVAVGHVPWQGCCVWRGRWPGWAGVGGGHLSASCVLSGRALCDGAVSGERWVSNVVLTPNAVGPGSGGRPLAAQELGGWSPQLSSRIPLFSFGDLCSHVTSCQPIFPQTSPGSGPRGPPPSSSWRNELEPDRPAPRNPALPAWFLLSCFLSPMWLGPRPSGQPTSHCPLSRRGPSPPPAHLQLPPPPHYGTPAG